MSQIKILDCTLRDGGYINDWKFGSHDIKSIVSRLGKANIDIVEVGFLEDGVYDPECSLFTDVEQIQSILPEVKGNTQYVAMTRFGYLNLDNLRYYDGKSINGIRVTFHEDEAEGAIEYCRQIKEKGYRVYVQPVGTTSYTDEYLLKLIRIVNELEPFAFYIVDTLGLMRKNDLLRMFFLIDNNLNHDVVIGFHSHNNLQLSFSNSQELADLHTKRSIILDSSVYGMGRGAGNLNTELIAQHLNYAKNSTYLTDYLLEIIDDTIMPLTEKYTWGYSVPYYLAAINNCHPNYATYLINKKTLPVKSISTILSRIQPEQRELYNKEHVAELYMEFQKNQIDDSRAIEELGALLQDKKVLVVAPGGKIKNQYGKIEEFLNSTPNVAIITVNFDGDHTINPDYCFFSNDRRFGSYCKTQVVNDVSYRVIATSNIESARSTADYVVNYGDYLNHYQAASDNATLMLLALLYKLGINSVHLAGFDGFEVSSSANYSEGQLETSLDRETLHELNRQITQVVKEYRTKINLYFVTDSMYSELA